MNDNARNIVSRFSTGIELRFKLVGDSGTVTLYADEHEEAQVAYIYYGSIQGGWQHSSKTIYSRETRITIPRSHNLPLLKQMTRDHDLPFDPEVVRIVLPYGTCYFVGVEGEIEPPAPADLPAKTYLAYGSSITHGSLALAAPLTYPFRIAQKLKTDYFNLGFAGSAHMEQAMAEYFVARQDWDFASVEMGINMIGEPFSLEQFEDRVKTFVEVLAGDPRPILATSLFVFNGKEHEREKAVRYREIVRKHAENKLIFTDGLELLNNTAYLSEDAVHPTLEGIGEIAARWSEVMKRFAMLKLQLYS